MYVCNYAYSIPENRLFMPVSSLHSMNNEVIMSAALSCIERFFVMTRACVHAKSSIHSCTIECTCICIDER